MTTVSNRDDDGKAKEDRTEGGEGKLSTSRKGRGILSGVSVSLLLEGLERESILGSEARFFVGAERNPLLSSTWSGHHHRFSESRDRVRAVGESHAPGG